MKPQSHMGDGARNTNEQSEQDPWPLRVPAPLCLAPVAGVLPPRAGRAGAA
ncbi:conserved hypothetical protein, partial [Ricinus communis]